LSGEALNGRQNKNLYDNDFIGDIAKQLAAVINNGMQLALVVGGGNIWRGYYAPEWIDRVKTDQIGMLATILNAIYLSEIFKQNGIQAVVMTPFHVGNMTQLFSKEEAIKHFANKTVVINAGGLGHPFFSTDTVTALRSAELEVDAVLYAKNIDGIYEDDPLKNPHSKKFKSLSFCNAINKNIKAVDLTALQILSDSNIPALFFGLNKPNSIIDACSFVQSSLHTDGTLMKNNIKEEFYDVCSNETV